MERGLVSCEWLKAELSRSDSSPLRVVDATWYLPNSPFAAPEASGGAQEQFLNGPRLPGATFFDIDAVSETHPEGLSPHMLPSEEKFVAAMCAMGVNEDTRVVVYDRHGIFSAPRFWYTLKVVFGHAPDVAVLDGGLPRWQALGYATEDGFPDAPEPAAVGAWKRNDSAAWNIGQVRGNVDAKDALVVDARPSARYLGSVPEPRPGMRGGHMPGSVNVPFVELLTAPPRTMLPPTELTQRLEATGVVVSELASKEANGPVVVTSCGSGLTACIVGLAMHQVGLPLSKWAVYDGSWAEWGALKDTPIVRQGADGQDEVVP